MASFSNLVGFPDIEKVTDHIEVSVFPWIMEWLCYKMLIVMQQSHTPFMEKTGYFILSGYFLANGG